MLGVICINGAAPIIELSGAIMEFDPITPL